MTDETPDTPPTTPPDEIVARAAAFRTKVEDLHRMLGEVTDQYERETRFWEAETLLDLTRSAVETLWHYLHHPEETEQPDAYTEGPLGRRVPTPETPTLEGPSWDAPEVELQYPVAFKWEDETVVLAKFTDTELGDDDEKWIEAGTEAAWNYRNLRVLDLITRGGRVRSDGTTLESLLPPDLVERFPALAVAEGTTKTTASWEQAEAVPDLVTEHVEAARAALQARYRPFLLTVTSLASVSHEWVIRVGDLYAAVMPPDLAALTLRDAWGRLSFENQRRFQWDVLDRTLAEVHKEANVENLPDLLQVKGHVQGTPFTATLRVAFHPLVLDMREPRRAFYPVTLSVIYAGDLPLAEWPEETRQKLWDAFLATLDRGLDGVRKSVAVQPPSPRPSPEPTPPSALQYAGPPPPQRRYLYDGETRITRNALALASRLGRLHLPRKWNTLKTWEEIEREEVKRLKEEYGDAAYKDQRTKTNPNAPTQLLEKRTGADGKEIDRLTAEHRAAHREAVGYLGFREERRDKDGVTREYLVKRFRVSGGYVETALSWYGSTWPLVDEGREKQADALRKAEEQARQGDLFDKLTEDTQKWINGRLRQLGAIRDGRAVMEYILGLFGKDGRNPVKVEAWNLRSLLECENDADGFDRVQGCLRALQELRYTWKVAGVPGLSENSVGPFLSDVNYVPRGSGWHTDGDFFLTVSDYFVGSLKVFQTATPRLRDPRVVGYDWNKDLSKEERKALGEGGGYLKGFSALSPYFDKAKGFTDTQTGLRQFLEHELTLRKDPASKKRHGKKRVRVRKNAPDANEPRIYTRDFCPLLAPDRQYHGALGHNRKNPEAGRKLQGTAKPGSATSGEHHAGLLVEMGYPPLPRGAAKRKRDVVIREALANLRAVVEEAFRGVVAGRYKDQWFSLQTATETLPVEVLAKEVTWSLFLAHDWRNEIASTITSYHAERHARGETPYQVAVTTDRALAEDGVHEDVIVEAVPLRLRLLARRERLALSQGAVGRVFGVSKVTVKKWEKAQTPIPADVVPLLARWVEDGTAPTPEELARLATRRAKKPGVRKAEA